MARISILYAKKPARSTNFLGPQPAGGAVCRCNYFAMPLPKSVGTGEAMIVFQVTTNHQTIMNTLFAPGFSRRRRTGHEELRHFQEVLRKGDPITHVLLSEWASNSDSRGALLAGGVWGGIRWPNGLVSPKPQALQAVSASRLSSGDSMQ